MAHADEDNAIYWYEPEFRGIIPLGFNPSKRQLKLLGDKKFIITKNECFAGVISACAERDETWISDDIVKTYTALHHMGYADSIEVWQDGELAGGLYGVKIGKAFFGESMFHRRTDCSKVALLYLISSMKAEGMKLLDTQFTTDHLQRFGAVEISRDEYQVLLKKALGNEYIGGGLSALPTFAIG